MSDKYPMTNHDPHEKRKPGTGAGYWDIDWFWHFWFPPPPPKREPFFLEDSSIQFASWTMTCVCIVVMIVCRNNGALIPLAESLADDTAHMFFSAALAALGFLVSVDSYLVVKLTDGGVGGCLLLVFFGAPVVSIGLTIWYLSNYMGIHVLL